MKVHASAKTSVMTEISTRMTASPVALASPAIAQAYRFRNHVETGRDPRLNHQSTWLKRGKPLDRSLKAHNVLDPSTDLPGARVVMHPSSPDGKHPRWGGGLRS